MLPLLVMLVLTAALLGRRHKSRALFPVSSFARWVTRESSLKMSAFVHLVEDRTAVLLPVLQVHRVHRRARPCGRDTLSRVERVFRDAHSCGPSGREPRTKE